MTQQINLYLPEFRRKRDRLNFQAMAGIVGLSVIMMALVSGIEFRNSYTLNQDLAEKQQQLQEARDRTNRLVDEFGAQSEDPELLAEVAELEENLSNKRALLQFLEGRSIGNTTGFSEFLADLSRFHIQGLRLTGIDLMGGGDRVVLSGEIVRAEYLPLYLQNLSQGESFNGKSFETLRIGEISSLEASQSLMRFSVATAGAAGSL